MLSGGDVVAFVATTRPEESRRFYKDALGLEFVADEVLSLVFRSKGTMLRIQKGEEFQHSNFTVLGWEVQDISRTVLELENAGIDLIRYHGLDQDEHGIARLPDGTRAAWFSDPDGNLLSISEFAE